MIYFTSYLPYIPQVCIHIKWYILLHIYFIFTIFTIYTIYPHLYPYISIYTHVYPYTIYTPRGTNSLPLYVHQLGLIICRIGLIICLSTLTHLFPRLPLLYQERSFPPREDRQVVDVALESMDNDEYMRVAAMLLAREVNEGNMALEAPALEAPS